MRQPEAKRLRLCDSPWVHKIEPPHADPQVIRSRLSNGNWLEPFDPTHITPHTEKGNSWQYTFSGMHDVPGLMAKLGRWNNQRQGLSAAIG